MKSEETNGRRAWRLLAVAGGLWLACAGSRGAEVETLISEGLFEPYGVIAAPVGERLYITDSSFGQNALVAFEGPDKPMERMAAGLIPSPQGAVFDTARGGTIVSSAVDHALYLVRPDGSSEVLAGRPGQRALADGRDSARFSSPAGLALDLAGRLVVADNGNGAIRRMAADGEVETLFEGFQRPAGVAVHPGSGEIFISDASAHVVYLANPETGLVRLIAGRPGAAGHADAVDGVDGELAAPHGLLWLGGEIGLLVADTRNHVLRRLRQPTGRTVWSMDTWAGTAGESGRTDGGLRDARFHEPTGLGVSRLGEILVADLKNHSIRKIGLEPVSAPALVPAGGLYNGPVEVVLTNRSTVAGIHYRYTLDDSEPVSSSALLPEPLILDGGPVTVRVKGFAPGFQGSDAVSGTYRFAVAPLRVEPPGGVKTGPVNVQVSSDTPGTGIRFTLDGTRPTEGSPETTGPVELDGNVTEEGTPLKVVGIKDGYEPSPVVEREYQFEAARPLLSAPAADGPYTNSVTVRLTTATSGAILRYTLDGTAPGSGNQDVGESGELELTRTSQLRVAAFRDQYLPSETVVTNYLIQVDKPRVSPAGGFFPEGTEVSMDVDRPDAEIFFTLNGQTPTRNDFRYSGPFRLDRVTFPNADLSQLRVRAFADGVLPSETVVGEVSGENRLGVSRSLQAGRGATVILPVNAHLQPGVELASLQFNLLIWPKAGGPPVERFRVMVPRETDFVPSSQGREGIPSLVTNLMTLGATNVLGISMVGNQNEFRLKEPTTVVLVGVTVPRGAEVGQRYGLQVTRVSGTRDGGQETVALASMEPREIEVTDDVWLVGDTSPASWYNAGEFGNGALDNSDVNNAFLASLGVRSPYAFCDLFNAMDVFPPDSESGPGGDGLVRFLDWQRILRLSLGHEAASWERSWGENGIVARKQEPFFGAALRAAEVSVERPGAVWDRQAMLSAGDLSVVLPGSTVKVPVWLDVAPAAEISGLQFRIVVEPRPGLPGVTTMPIFERAEGIPAPLASVGLGPSELSLGWNLGAFQPPLTGRVRLGDVKVQLPMGGLEGDWYTVDFANADGSPDSETQYDVERRKGTIWIKTAAPPVDPISQEWREHFFGDDGGLAKAGEDPDGDGVSNEGEFLLGTDPVNAESRMQVSGVERAGAELAIRWLGAPGVFYQLEWLESDWSGWKGTGESRLGNGMEEEVRMPMSGRLGLFRLRGEGRYTLE